MNPLLTAALVIFIPTSADAQIYQCRDASGRVSMQQVPCAGDQKGKMVATPAETAPRPAPPPGSNPDARYLTSLVAEAITQRDYARAERLAVTAEHWDMITSARARDARAKAEEREARMRNLPQGPIIQNQPSNTTCRVIGNQMHCYTY